MKRKCAKYRRIIRLTSLSVIEDCPGIQYDSKNDDGKELMLNIMKITAFQHYHTHYFYEIFKRVQVCYHFCPFRHAFNGRIKPAEQVEDHDKEKRKRHGLLLSVGIR